MTAEFTSEQIRTSLERVLASDEFVTSAQLSRFLRYIVENGLPGVASLSGGADLLKESVVGVAVFKRGPSYDPKTDPIVRVEARRLRSRLQAYYQNGGSSDPVRISLPKGAYAPAFEVIETAAAEMPADTSPRPSARGARRRRLTLAIVAGIAAVVVGVAADMYWSESLVSRFWTSLLGGERPVLLIPADSGLVMLQNLTRVEISLQDYIAGDYRTRLAALSAFDPAMVSNLSNRRYTSIADLEFAAGLARRPEAARQAPRIRYARDVRPEELKSGSVILLGARHSNPWVGLFESDATFRIEDDERTSSLSVINLSPQAGEQREITRSPEEIRREIYAIVTYHRRREGPGFALVVAGMSLAGTEAAVNFVLDDARLSPWLEKARSGGRSGEFDVLLHGRNLGGSSLSADVIAFHPKNP
jgi:hypothetical protein